MRRNSSASSGSSGWFLAMGALPIGRTGLGLSNTPGSPGEVTKIGGPVDPARGVERKDSQGVLASEGEVVVSEKQAFHNIINGEVQASASGAMMDIINPSTGEVYASAPMSDAHDVDQACQAAGKAFETWRWSTPSERQRALLKLADVIEENAEELVAIESENTGKPIGLTMSEEIPPMVDQIRFFAGAARVLEGKSSGEYMRGFTSSIRREPVGPVAQVAPWNYPMLMSVWKFAPALAAGNTVVLKPSDTTPASSYWMVEKMQDIYPAGRLQPRLR